MAGTGATAAAVCSTGRYDALLWFDETTAVRPPELAATPTGELETYPWST